MRVHALAALAAAVMAGNAGAADERYDRRLDRAAAEIVAARIGQLRGGFAPGASPVLSLTQEEAAPAPEPRQAVPELRPGMWRDGLAIAVERKSRVSPEL